MVAQLHKQLPALVAILLSFVGCGTNEKPATLVVHYHDSVYDLIDHDGTVIATANDLDEFESLSRQPKIKSLICGNRIVARVAPVDDEYGIGPPNEVDLLMGRLIHAEVVYMEFEYTDSPDQ